MAHKHIFINAHGSNTISGTISMHGFCKLCKQAMSLQGSIDDKGNGFINISLDSGGFREKREIKNNIM